MNYTWGVIQLCYRFYKDTKYKIKIDKGENYTLIKFCDIYEYILKYYDLIQWQDFIEIINNAVIGNQIFYSLWLVDSFYGEYILKNV